MTTRQRKPTRMVAAGLFTVLGAILVLAGPASASVSNPGPFTTTVLGGSTLTLNGSGTVFRIGTAACGDTTDNDADTLIDFPADTQCASAADANERLAGAQAYVAPKVNSTVTNAATNNISVAANGYVFPSSELCVNTTSCLTVTISAAAATTGTINPEGPTGAAADGTITLPINLRVDLDPAVGFPGLPAACAITGITGTLNSANYNKTNGNATLANTAPVNVPTTSGCGILYGPLINGALSLPTTANATLLTQTRNAANQPVLP
jgi:hypothetical protein